MPYCLRNALLASEESEPTPILVHTSALSRQSAEGLATVRDDQCIAGMSIPREHMVVEGRRAPE